MGLKRKLEEPGDTGTVFQRQSILDISMFKLQSSPVKRVEPSLLRSVLILNTLKHIEVELQKDGFESNLANSSTFAFDDNSDISMDILPDLHSNTNHEVIHHEGELNVSKTSSSPLPPIETFVELSNVSGTVPAVFKHSLDEKTKCDKNDIFSSQSFHPTSPVKVEDMLADFDFTQTDFDIFSSLTSSMKLTPLSAEEVIHSFPAHSNVITESYASLFNASLNNTCKGEVLPEEIESIMQILVGT